MPSLFDSHDEFNEWFSKDIENAAENKGSKLNEHQLRRLHMILKPFMLRRVKRHVQNELSDKASVHWPLSLSSCLWVCQIEVDIHVEMSARQRALYDAMRAKVSVTDLLEKAATYDMDSQRSLMNLVMQFRKVRGIKICQGREINSPSVGCQPSGVVRTCRRYRTFLVFSIWQAWSA